MPHVLRRMRGFLSSALLGGISFWLPVTGIEILKRGEIGPAIGTILPFATQLGCYFFARRHNGRPRLAIPMLAGLYLLGPFFMEIDFTVRGAGFSQFHGWRDVGYLLLCSIFPPATLMLATYQMTLLGVIFSSVAMLLLHFRYEKTRVSQALNQQ
jgi:hypothetical protein